MLAADYQRIKYGNRPVRKRKLLRAIAFLMSKRHGIVSPPAGISNPLPSIVRRYRTIDSFNDEGVPQW